MKFIYVPQKQPATQTVGGLRFDAVAAYEYTPKNNPLPSGGIQKEDKLKVVLVGSESDNTLYFFGDTARELLRQIEKAITESN